MQEWLNDVGNWFRVNLENLIAALLIIVGFVVAAYLIKWLIAKAIDATGFAKRAAATSAETDKKPVGLGSSVGNAAFWIIILIGLVQALDRLGMDSVVGPLNRMFGEMFAYLPNIIGAILLFVIFLIVANVVKQASKAVLVFADPMPEKVGLASGPVDVSGVTSSVLFAVIAILGGIAALDVLAIKAISGPANAMLSEIVSAIPRILVAIIILALFWFVARFVTGLIRRTLPSFGLDKAVSDLGLLKGADANVTVTNIAAWLAMFFIMLLGVVQALQALDFQPLTNAMGVVLSMGSQIVFGALIIFAGVFIASFISRAMASAGSGASDVAATGVKWVIIVLASILGISRMGLDTTGGEFIVWASLILLAGTALALGIAFGLGGREWASRQLEGMRGPDKSSATPAASRRKTPPASE